MSPAHLTMKIAYLTNVLTLLVMLAAPGSYSLPATGGDDDTAQAPDTALDAAVSDASDLADFEGGRAQRGIVTNRRNTVPSGIAIYVFVHEATFVFILP